MHTAYLRPAPNTPKRRLIQRRQQADRRLFLRWYPHGEDRRDKPSRRQNDRWDTMKAMISSLFLPRDNPESIGRKKKRS